MRAVYNAPAVSKEEVLCQNILATSESAISRHPHVEPQAGTNGCRHAPGAHCHGALTRVSVLRIVWIGWLANVQKDSLSPGRARAPTLGGAEKMLCSSMPSSTLKTEHGKRKLFLIRHY